MNTLAYKLSPQQSALLNKQGFNPVCSLTFDVKDVSSGEIKEKITQITKKYVAFRLSFFHENDEVLQIVEDETKVIFHEGKYIGESVSVTDMPPLQVYIDGKDKESSITLLGNPLCVDIHSLNLIKQQVNGSQLDEEIDYLKFSEWQHQLQDEESAIEGKQYWKQLKSYDSPHLRVELKPEGAPSIKTINKSLPENILSALKSDNAEAVFFAVYSELIKKLSIINEFSIGLESNGREFDELNETVGQLSKIVPVNIDEQTHLDANSISEQLELARSYQFYYKRNEQFDYQFSILSDANNLKVLQALQSFKLKCHVLFNSTAATIGLSYDQQYLTEETISYLLELYMQLLEQSLNGIVVHGNIYSTPAIDNKERDIIKRLKAIAKQYPHNTAVKASKSTLTYQQLDEISDKLAVVLSEKYNLVKGDIAGLLIDNSEWMPIAILAVLKTGAAYLPLDADNPKERLQNIIDDSSPSCIITVDSLKDELKYSGQLILVEEAIDEEVVSTLSVSLTGEEPLYMIYTSGTTGKPKGVKISGDNLLNYVEWLHNEFDITHKDKSTLQSSYAYDLGYTSLWGCLLSGAELNITTPEQRADSAWLVDHIINEGITYLKLTPSVFYLLLQADNIRALAKSNLRLIILGGEKIDVESLQQFKRIKSDVLFVNHYGPTETTIGTLFYKITSSDLEAFSRKPFIGKPIAGNEVLLLDTDDNVCIPGELGEICIAGAGVTNGYYNREELTKEKFINFHFGSRELRIYKTGDLGYGMPDGNIVIEGRVDEQVKIRGHRIELGELKQALVTVGLNDVVLRLMKATGFGEELVCYYKSTEEIDQVMLREKLNAIVPDYMIPSFFVRISSIPLTPNGKVNTKVLPDPHKLLVESASEGTDMTKTEQQVAEVWAAVLNVPVVANSDFFVSGGDSIKAIQIVAKLNKLGLACKLADIFEYTTVTDLAAHINPEDTRPESSIEKKTIVESKWYGLSPMQDAMWFHHKMYPESKANIIVRQFEVKGNLNIKALTKSLQQAFEHYDILRIRFGIQEDNAPKLKIGTAPEHSLEVVDLSSSDIETAYQHIQQAQEELIISGFDLEKDVLFRVKLFRLRDRNVLLLNYHHIIMDGWCLNIIVKEIMGCYAAICNDKYYEWAEYTPFTKYLEWLDNQSADIAGAYWQKYLEGYESVASVPFYDSKENREYDGRVKNHFIDKETSSAIRNFCNSRKVTLNNFLQTAWGIVLGKYNNTHDIVYGITVSGRPYEIEGYENMLGLFINTLPLRVKWQKDTTVNELLLNVRNNFYEAQPHQTFSLSEIQSRSSLKKDLLNHVLVFENYPLSSVEEESNETGISVSATGSFGQVNYDFGIVAYPDEEIVLSFMYNANKYPVEQVEHIYHHLLQTMQNIITAPDSLVKDIDCLHESEKESLLSWGNSEGLFDKEKTIADYVDESLSDFTDRIAIEDNQQEISYTELSKRVNNLASILVSEYNVKPEDKVALLISPSIDTIVAILAVIKAGAVYVPIDVEFPKERQQYMISDSDSVLLLTNEEIQEKIQEGLTTLDIRFLSTSNFNVELPKVSPENLAYIIYTSGSTGQPKGCKVTHRNLVKLFKQQKEWMSFNEYDVWVLAHSYTFDFSVWEIFGAILNGGKLYIPSRDDVRDTISFAQKLSEKDVTILNQTPMAFYQFVDVISKTSGTLDNYNIRLVVFAGERLEFVKLKPWLDIKGSQDVELYNMYGITETTIHSTWYKIKPSDIIHSSGKSIIGVPIPSTKMYVVNNVGQLCPIGVFGEILVGGEGVCDGYNKKNELTAQRFIKDPIYGEGIVYRSGDVGRWLLNGTIEYLHRIDSQVQIRGYRVEPAEALYWLQNRSDIKEVFVSTPVINDEYELVAYCVAPGDEPNTKELRSYLREHLPAHFIPQYFIFLNNLPITPNGKVDIKKLPLPSDVNRTDDSVMTTDIIEQKLIDIWEQELGVAVNAYDDFFEVGGHSLKAMRMIGEVQKQFDITVPAAQLYNHPVLKDLAAVVKDALGKAYTIVESHHIQLNRADSIKTLFMLPPAVGYAFGFGPLAASLSGWNVFGINFIEENTFERMARLIGELQPEGEIVLCGFSASGSLSFHVTKILESMGRKVKAIIMLDSRRFIKAEPLAPEEVKSIAQEYMKDPRAEEYITSPIMREVMRKRIEASISFIHSLKDDGEVNTDVYYIRSETNRNNDKRVSDWQEVISGDIHLYEGMGEHAAMLDKQNLEHNTAIYKEIISHL